MLVLYLYFKLILFIPYRIWGEFVGEEFARDAEDIISPICNKIVENLVKMAIDSPKKQEKWRNHRHYVEFYKDWFSFELMNLIAEPEVFPFSNSL